MNNRIRVLGYSLLIGLLVGVSGAGQDDGAIVGWGAQVVVPQSALTDLVGVAAGGTHSLACA